ncbi:uncharacterized protein TRUGW13939_00877 [Talaromyces rugulosus]|uniref:Endonuclease/exonuclease/phosphatase domain-containing protein n=1 Tax=Talaromyces rugulosus TaxID=121627 RepID=A0A7H8QIJ2_TALRU|nr:uncharacterized protein TRUGW13939_00877 [Talaromyces rugulosus]QKX53797.1 hypothetical protein TRUGW13939_00877 [Talaromyces rugulosus]
MDKLVQEAIQKTIALKKQPSSIPWKHDEPWSQACYSWSNDKNEWQPTKSTSSGTQAGISTLAVYSWNIDFMLPFPDTRMDAALAHLHEKLTSELQQGSTTAVVVNLQECVPSDLVAISQKQWVRDSFYMTDLDSSTWESGVYGTTTLVDRRLDISSCFRVHYSKTQMERDALFVDVTVSGKKLRVCNTHLESLAREPPLRPAQMQIIASQMHAGDAVGAIVTGDFNAIQPFDLSLHSDNGLKDAYLELGGVENSDDGYTWGQQALSELRQLFGCSRMDKAYYRGPGIKLLSFDRFGADVEVAEHEKEQREKLIALGFEKAWVTDHLGIKAVFQLTGDLRL